MQLWTPEHARTLLPALALMLTLTLGLRVWLGKKPLAVRMLPLQVCTCLLLLLEVGKQVLSLCRGYDLYHLPLHYCSLFLFVMPLMAFYRGPHRQKVNALAAAICAAVFALLMIYPSLIYGAADVQNFSTDYFSFHTVAYHNIVILMLLLILVLDLYTPGQRMDQRAVIVSIVVFCAVAATMAQILKTNYANYYTCNIPVLETVRQTVEKAIGTLSAKLIYISIVSALNILFTWGAYKLYCLLHKFTKIA